MLKNGKHSYGLSWIDEDKLYRATLDCFSKVLGLSKGNKDNPPDPFTIVAQSMVTNTTLEANLAFETVRKTNKTLSNAVGNFHQRVLGLSPNWESTGASGGLIDLRTVHGYLHPRFGKPVVAEVKNRFNTMKAVEEPGVWDKIDHASKVMGGAQGYLFQITPKTPERYDKEWTPSNRVPRDHIRVCDGATAYELVFSIPAAMKELYLALPEVFLDIKKEHGLTVPADMPSPERLAELYNDVYPD